MAKIYIVLHCPLCDKEHNLEVDEDKYLQYQMLNRPCIQDIWPDESIPYREKIKSGYCDECQELMFARPDDED